jgi:hypothetical protein
MTPAGGIRVPTKKRSRKKHQAKASLHVHELSRAGSSLTLQLYADQLKIGELEIGRGAMYWYGRHRHKRKRIDWTRFADMMDELAYGAHSSR